MKKYTLLPLCALFFLTACSKETEIRPELDQAVLEFRSATLGMETRASEGYSDYESPFKVNLAAKPGAYTATVSTFTKSSSVWTGTPVIYLSPEETTITAWAPATLSAANPLSAPTVFTLNPQLYTEEQDLVYFKSHTVNATNNAVDIKLDRAYSMVTLKLVKTNYPGEGLFSGLTLSGSAGVSTIDISTGGITPSSAADLPLAGGLVSQSIPEEGIKALVVPQNTVSLSVSCTVDGRTYSGLSISGITQFEPAKNYVITMTLTGTVLTISSVEIQNWINVNDAGNVTVQ